MPYKQPAKQQRAGRCYCLAAPQLCPRHDAIVVCVLHGLGCRLGAGDARDSLISAVRVQEEPRLNRFRTTYTSMKIHTFRNRSHLHSTTTAHAARHWHVQDVSHGQLQQQHTHTHSSTCTHKSCHLADASVTGMYVVQRPGEPFKQVTMVESRRTNGSWH